MFSLQISLYNLINDELIERMNFHTSEKLVSYHNSNDEGEQLVDFTTDENQLIINEIDSLWSPIEHNLIIKQDFFIDRPSELFGSRGVTNQNNVLGLACHIYSKTSHFQTTVHVGDIQYTNEKIELNFQHEFQPNEIGGMVFFNFYIYLKNSEVVDPFSANIAGTNLMENPLEEYVIIVDGSGSEFPIEEINDPTQPLWLVEMNWTEVDQDLFNNNSVRLILNNGHEIFNQLMNQRNKINQYLMNDIIINSMAMVITQVIVVEKFELNEDIDYPLGTIAQVVAYWISTYEINTENFQTITNSLRKNADSFVKGAN